MFPCKMLRAPGRQGHWVPVFVTLAVAFCGLRPLSAADPGRSSLANTPAGQVLDLAGRPVDPFDGVKGKAIVLVFVANECPISNSYAPELRRLYEGFAAKGVTFWAVHADATEPVEAIRQHAREFQLPMGILRDPQHVLVRRAQAHVTPEAAVFLANGRLVYHGRIDNRYADLGKARPQATEHDLQQVLQAILEGKPVPVGETRAIGCYIP